MLLSSRERPIVTTHLCCKVTIPVGGGMELEDNYEHIFIPEPKQSCQLADPKVRVSAISMPWSQNSWHLSTALQGPPCRIKLNIASSEVLDEERHRISNPDGWELLIYGNHQKTMVILFIKCSFLNRQRHFINQLFQHREERIFVQ